MKARPYFFFVSSSLIALMSFVATTLRAQDPLDSWAPRLIPGFATNLTGIAFGNGVFVSVGEASTVARSEDGVDWTVSTAGAFGNLAGVRFLNGQFVALGSSDKILFSADGISCTGATLPSAGNWDAAYGNGAYVVAGSKALVSTNGTDWTETTPQITDPFFGIVTPKLGSIVSGLVTRLGKVAPRLAKWGHANIKAHSQTFKSCTER
jgi:hypothetical protein